SNTAFTCASETTHLLRACLHLSPNSRPASDGDVSTWPISPYTQRQDQGWRQKLAESWVKDTGTHEEGELSQTLRYSKLLCMFLWLPLTDLWKQDSYLFGHPSGKPFNSSVTFFPHFLGIVSSVPLTMARKCGKKVTLELKAARASRDHIPVSEPPAMATSSSSAPQGESKGGLAQTSKMVSSGLGDASEANDNDNYDNENDLTDEEFGDIPDLPPSAGHDVATESDNMNDLA
ncbi:uncharacterized protein N7515_008704, partial [Penicillium bovifimosum]